MINLAKKMKYLSRSIWQTKEERRHALVGPPDLWKMKRDFQIRFLIDMGLNPDHFLFEIGCGTLRGGLPIIQYLDVAHYFGVEVREGALEEGKKELREAGLIYKKPALILSSDISQLDVDRKFDYMWAFSVLIHMDDRVLSKTLNFVSKNLSKQGVFYANVNIGDSKDGAWQGFPVVTREFEFYKKACVANSLEISELGPLKKFGHITNITSQDNQMMIKINRMI